MPAFAERDGPGGRDRGSDSEGAARLPPSPNLAAPKALPLE
jgi:hypothetical protein